MDARHCVSLGHPANSWVSDDAYISFRTVDNFVHGYGLRWNTDERVQSFTNPLWVLIMSIPYAITGEMYYTAIFVSLAFVLLAVWILIRKIAVSNLSALFTLSGLIVSKAFIDYSTSGLEQPLLYFLLALFIWRYAKFDGRPQSFGWLACIAALSATTRMDTILIYFPALFALFWQCRSWKAVKYGLWGFASFIVWELFTIIYFGFPFPNTYYAKLHAGIPLRDLIIQGFIYYLESISSDPITLTIIVTAIVLTLFRKISGYTAIALGIAAYLCYVVRTGGDFMGGRFFALVLFGSVALLSRLVWTKSQLLGAVAILLILGFAAPSPTLLSASSFGKGNSGVGANGVTDERALYYQVTGLLKARHGIDMPDHDWAKKGKGYALRGTSLVTEGSVGFAGFYAGPQVHIIDGFALCEPLLARLPANVDDRWITGHFPRTLPAGYMATLQSGSNRITDTDLAAYYDKLCMVTKSPLFSTDRVQAIVAMNTGKYDHLLSRYWDTTAPEIAYTDFSTPVKEGTAWNAQGVRVLRRNGVIVRFDSLMHQQGMEISLDQNDTYAASFYKDTILLGRVDIAKRTIPSGGMRTELVTIPELASNAGYNRIHISPISGDDAYSIGYLHLLDSLPAK